MYRFILLLNGEVFAQTDSEDFAKLEKALHPDIKVIERNFI